MKMEILLELKTKVKYQLKKKHSIVHFQIMSESELMLELAIPFKNIEKTLNLQI